MNFQLSIPLNPSPEQLARLKALQAAFAAVCSALGPIVQQTRCWNRVALHHIAYRTLREQFPQMGSQMVCNAIYSVSRACRIVFQHPNSPLNVAKLGDRPLPLLQFQASAPVYFDRHTLSLKDGRFSMYTLDGRMRFHIELKPEDEARFHETKLREIILRSNRDCFQLLFNFAPETDDGSAISADMPEYLIIKDSDTGVDLSLFTSRAIPADATASMTP